MPPRQLSVAIKDRVKAEFDEMCRNGIIEPVSEASPWVSALLVVTKPNGRLRICLDTRPLNKALTRSVYAMPTIDDILPQLAKAKVFRIVDATQGFTHVKLDKESSALTTFETPFSRYRWLRLPFGTSPSSEIFQAKMHETLNGLKGIACVADDILIFGCRETKEEADADHDRNTIVLLHHCREKGLHLKKEITQLSNYVVNQQYSWGMS